MLIAVGVCQERVTWACGSSPAISRTTSSTTSSSVTWTACMWWSWTRVTRATCSCHSCFTGCASSLLVSASPNQSASPTLHLPPF